MEKDINKNLFIYIILVIILASLASLLYMKAFINNEKELISYNEKSKSDYKIKLKQNDYYEFDSLPSGMNYIATLIDKIDVDYDYYFTSSNKIDYNATYSIDAIVRIYDNDDNSVVLFEKKENILPEQRISAKDSQGESFRKKIEIDYEHFNNLAKAFKSSFNLTTNSDLTIVLNINSSAVKDGFKDKINYNNKATMVIPLTEKTINITIDDNNIQNKKVISKTKTSSKTNSVFFVLFVVFALLTIVSLILLVKSIIKKYNSKDKYQRELSKILRENDSIIANATHKINLNDYQVVDISSFEELRDVHDNIGAPILYSYDEKLKTSYFTIAKDNLLYRYILSYKKTLGGKNESVKKK